MVYLPGVDQIVALPAADIDEVKKELDRARDELKWATLRETRELFAGLAAAPAKARDLVDGFHAELSAKRPDLEKEAKEQRFAG